SWAIAMPRSASAGASPRRATRFRAPRGSPAASACAAAVISESIGIPTHLSLPSSRTPWLSVVASRNEPTPERKKETRAMTKHKTGTRKEWLAARLELLAAEKELTRHSDELARRRGDPPSLPIPKPYPFATPPRSP